MVKSSLFFLVFSLIYLPLAQAQPKISSSSAKSVAVPEISLIPKPRDLSKGGEAFLLDGSTRIVSTETAEIRPIATYLAERIAARTGYALQMATAEQDAASFITLALDPKVTTDEGYEFTAAAGQISLRAQTARGLFYGVQTLLQLLPSPADQPSAWLIPGVQIKDSPRFAWRGMHLDVARHVMPKDFIKKYIDYLALHKMNVFHWHLTDDQGWRIDIKKHPQLTTIGAWRTENGARYGGFYTQDEIREIVAYAESRFVTVVPEIELPGHALAALAAYPQLSCTGGPFTIKPQWGVFNDVFCAGNDQTFKFLEEVLDEVISLFPGRYIHIGGDEVPKHNWESCSKCQARMMQESLQDEQQLQSYFIKRIQAFLTKRGKFLIGWDEIMEGGLPPGATVMAWRGVKQGSIAAKAGNDVIMTPASHLYFNHKQENLSQEPGHSGRLTLEMVYSFEPIPADISGSAAQRVLGAQGNIWTEYILNEKQVELLAFPRMTALAELVWTPSAGKNFNDFMERLGHHFKRLDEMKADYFIPLPFGFKDINIFTGEFMVEIKKTILTRCNPIHFGWNRTYCDVALVYGANAVHRRCSAYCEDLSAEWEVEFFSNYYFGQAIEGIQTRLKSLLNFDQGITATCCKTPVAIASSSSSLRGFLRSLAARLTTNQR